MTVAYEGHGVTVHIADALDVLAGIADASVDAVVTDPPYGLEFMGKGWDAPWQEADVNADAGFHGGGISQTAGLPSFTGSSNPKCLNCKGTRRGRRDGTAKVAVCLCVDGGRFPNTRAVEMRAFGDWCELWATECLRVLKPGGHLLAFGGTRTWHRLACAVEDAGFEVRDSIAWLYGSGFPKSLDVSKAIDKRRDWSLVERLSGEIRRARAEAGLSLAEIGQATLDATDGTYGKWYHRGGHMFFETGRSLPSRPEWEHLRHVLPIAPKFAEVYDEAEREVIGERETTFLARKKADGSTVTGDMLMADERGVATIRETLPATDAAQQWAGWGTALKPAFEPVVVARKPLAGTVAANVLAHGTGALNIDGCRINPGHVVLGGSGNRESFRVMEGRSDRQEFDGNPAHTAGRWPANVVLDESQAEALDEQSGDRPGFSSQRDAVDAKEGGSWLGTRKGTSKAGEVREGFNDSGGASRFFYVAKADTTERPRVNGTAHPTVKPLSLMRWLVRLVTPPGGTVLEPFAGSGTTVEACIIEGFDCIAIEKGDEYLPLIMQRINRRRDPVEAIRQRGEDLGLFDHLEGAP